MADRPRQPSPRARVSRVSNARSTAPPRDGSPLTVAPRPVPRPRFGPVIEGWPEATRTAFLEELARFGNVTAAARQVGLHRGSLYDLRRRDPEFAAAWTEAEALGVAGLEAEAIRRAAQGVAEPVFFKGVRALDYVLDENGEPVVDPETGDKKLRPASIRRYSDHLMAMLLRAHAPDRYREKPAPPRTDGVPALDLTLLSDDELVTFAHLMRKARVEDAIDVTPSADDPE